jgi:hypothetical protein
MAMRAKGALFFVLAAAAARAGDPPAPDSIATAKKDFATIKSLGSPADAGSLLPSMDMKDLGPSPGAHIDAPPALPDPDALLDPTKKKEKEGTGNWLVDAMDKKSDRSSPTGKDSSLKSDPDLLRSGDRTLERGDREAQASPDARDKAGESEMAESVVNPLDSFMAGWISTRDHDLLLPTVKSDGAVAGGAGRTHAEGLDDLDLGQGTPSDGPIPSPEVAGWSEAKPDSNPFITALELDSAPQGRIFSTPDTSGFAPTALQNGPAAMGVDPAALDSGRTFIPDFAQPSDDDKYFKQMKKF